MASASEVVDKSNEVGGGGDASFQPWSHSHTEFSFKSSADESCNENLKSAYTSESCTKMRKIDKDGFTTPASPVSAHHPYHHIDNKSQENDELSSKHYGRKDRTSEETESLSCKDLENMNDRSTESKSRQKPLGDIVKELGHTISDLYRQWSQNFQESENFESFSESRLDRILEKALEYESTLKNEKAKLADRLQNLAKTLQAD